MAITKTRQPREVRTRFTYLARDELYQREKPYGTDFPVNQFAGAESTNHLFEPLDVVVHDARRVEHTFSLKEQGFCFARPDMVSPERLAIEEKAAVEDYYEQLESFIAQSFPEYRRVEVIDHLVRKRHPGFPAMAGKEVEDAQPAALPHSDFTTAGSFLRMKLSCPGQEEYYENEDFDILNAWRVLKGPNNDWPLALCDYRSVDIEKDTIGNDVLHVSDVGENWLLFPSEKHSWHYLSDQTPDELIIFRNANSKDKQARAFHAAFDSGMPDTSPRESIEVRFACFR